MVKPDLAAPAPAGYEQVHLDVLQRALAGEFASFEEAQAEYARQLRKPAPLTMQTYAAQLRRKTVLLSVGANRPTRSPIRRVSIGTRPRGRRVVRRARARSPGREDPEPLPHDVAHRRAVAA